MELKELILYGENDNVLLASNLPVFTDMPHYQWDALTWLYDEDRNSRDRYCISLRHETEKTQKDICDWFYKKGFKYHLAYIKDLNY